MPRALLRWRISQRINRHGLFDRYLGGRLCVAFLVLLLTPPLFGLAAASSAQRTPTSGLIYVAMQLRLMLLYRVWMQQRPSMCSSVDGLRWPLCLAPLAHSVYSILADKGRMPCAHRAHTQAYPNQGFQEQIKLYDAYCRGGGAQGMLGAMGAVRSCILLRCCPTFLATITCNAGLSLSTS